MVDTRRGGTGRGAPQQGNANNDAENLALMNLNPQQIAAIFAAMQQAIDKGIMEALNINKDTAFTSLQELRNVFSELSRKLKESKGEYLMDDASGKKHGFTTADLTFAALAYPILRPPEMRNWLLEMVDLPDEINDLTKEFAATTAGQHVLKV